MSRLKKGSRKKLTPLFSNRGVTFWKKWILEPPKALWGLGLQDSERGHKVLIFRSQSAYILAIFWGWIFPERKKRAESPRKQAKACFFLILILVEITLTINTYHHSIVNRWYYWLFGQKKTRFTSESFRVIILGVQSKIMKGEVRIFCISN